MGPEDNLLLIVALRSQSHFKSIGLVTDEDEEEFIEDEEDLEEGVSTEEKEGENSTFLCPCAISDRSVRLYVLGGGIIILVLPSFCTPEVCRFAHVCDQG